MTDEIMPFRGEVSQAALEDLRDRSRRTRWPDEEPVGDWSQGAAFADARPVRLFGR